MSIRNTAFLLLISCTALQATTITIQGTINQSTADSGTPAVNNPSLNNIADGDAYTVTLTFSGPVTAPGTFALTSVLFSDPTAPASESAFISGSMTITQSAGNDQFSVLGCLIDASSCLLGNELDLNFMIPDPQLLQTGVSAQPIPALLPLDLLEDDGNTDIHGTVSSYSYAADSAVPEPSTLGMFGAALASLTILGLRSKQRARSRARH